MIEISIDDFSREDKDEFEFMYRPIQTIASGAFGTVIKALDLHHQREVAVKIISKETYDKSQIRQLEQEVEILSRLDNGHIVKFETFIETKKKMYIVMEYCSGGSLKSYMEKHKGTLTEAQAKVIINALLSAVNYLHQRDICHRDIKPENVMFSEEDNIDTLKLVDFGLSAQYFEQKEEFDYCGTLLYMAPEQIHKKTYSKGIDIWSVGIILFKLLNDNRHPLWVKEDSRKAFINKLKEQPIQLFNNCSEMAKSLLMKLLERSPSFRYSAQNALDHPWISGRKDAPIPETVFDKLKKGEMKKKLLLMLNASLFMIHFSGKNNALPEDYDRRVRLSGKKDKEQCQVTKDIVFSLKDEQPSAVARPASQNCIGKKNNLLLKLSKRSLKQEFFSKETIQSKKSKTKVNDNSRSSTNNSEQKKFDKLTPQEPRFSRKGYLFNQHRSSKLVSNNPDRTVSIQKKATAELLYPVSPYKYMKRTSNALIKYKVPFNHINGTRSNIKKSVTKAELLLPKI